MFASSIPRLFLGFAILGLFAVSQPLIAQDATVNQPDSLAKPTIVLVHGAFADGSAWQKVIPLLQQDGYNVIAVQNPLSALEDDIATTKRVIDAQKGPVVVVGHSYGGAVITAAASGNPNVKALVYIAAFAPDTAEPVAGLTEKYPTELSDALRPDSAGYLYIDRAMFHELFAQDVSEKEASVMAATQKPADSTTFSATITTQPAWKTIPTWYLVAENDHTINPDLERFYAKRMDATTREVESSHVPFISHPDVVVEIIEEAAVAVAR